MKTIREHFLDMGPKIAKLCIVASIRSKGNDGALDAEADNAEEASNYGINWTRTTEGSSFWAGFNMALEEDGDPNSDDEDFLKGYNLGLKAKQNIERLQS